MSGTRVAWLDVVRGWAMVLIALGHSLLGLMTAGLVDAAGWPRAVVIFLYLFHMPAIFFISGYVSSDARKTPGDFLASLGRWIVLPYFLWSAVLIVSQRLGPGSNQPIPLEALLAMPWKPIGGFWFLYALFLVKVAAYAASSRFGASLKTSVVLAASGALLSALLGASPDIDPLASKILSSLFFYELGELARLTGVLPRGADALRRHGPAAAALGLVCLFCLLVLAAHYAGLPANAVAMIWEPQSLFLLSGTLGIVMLVSLAQLCASGAFMRVSTTVGVYSMVIYVQHVIWGGGARALLTRLHVSSAPVLLLGVLAAALTLPILWQMAADRLRVSGYFGIRPAPAKA